MYECVRVQTPACVAVAMHLSFADLHRCAHAACSALLQQACAISSALLYSRTTSSRRPKKKEVVFNATDQALASSPATSTGTQKKEIKCASHTQRSLRPTSSNQPQRGAYPKLHSAFAPRRPRNAGAPLRRGVTDMLSNPRSLSPGALSPVCNPGAVAAAYSAGLQQ